MSASFDESVGTIENVDETGKVYLKESHGMGSVTFKSKKLKLPHPIVPKKGDEVVYSSIEGKVVQVQIKKFNERAHKTAEFDAFIASDPADTKHKREASTMCAAVYCVIVQSAAAKSIDVKKKYFELICRFISRVPYIEEPHLKRQWTEKISPVIGLVVLKFRDVIKDKFWVRDHIKPIKEAVKAVYIIRPTTTWIEVLYVVSRIEPGFQKEIFNAICTQKKYNPRSRESLSVGPGQDGNESIRAMTSLGGLKPIPLDRGYLSPRDFLDTNFNLLRADCFFSLAGNITLLNEGRRNDVIMRDIPLYTNVDFDVIDNERSIMYNMTCTVRYKQMVQPPRLCFGNLIAISVSGEFRDTTDDDENGERDIFWAMIEEDPSEEERSRAEMEIKSKGSSRISFSISFCRFANGAAENDGKAIMAIFKNYNTFAILDSDAFIIAYESILDVLKNQNENLLPFQEEFVYARQAPEKAPPKDEQKALLDILETRKDIYGTLDPGQIECYKHFVENRVALIQGPPGTGKSYLGTRIAYALNQVGYKSILIMSYKNHSLDDFVIDIHDILGESYKLGKIARLGGNPKKDPKVAECSLDCLANMMQSKGTYIDELHSLKGKFKSCFGYFKSMIKDLDNNFKTLDLTYEDFCDVYKAKSYFDDLFGGTRRRKDDDDDDDDDEDEDENDYSRNDKHDCKEVERKFNEWKAKLISTIRQKLRKYAPKSKRPAEKEHVMTAEELFNLEVQDEESEKESLLKLKKQLKEDEEAGKIVFEERAEIQYKKSQNQKIKVITEKLLSSRSFESSEFAQLYSVYSVPSEQEMREDLDSFDDMASQENMLRGALLLRYEEALTKISDYMTELKKITQKITELIGEAKADILREASFVCCTSTGSGLFHSLLKEVKPDALVIEESGEIPEPVLVASLYPTLKRIIMIGDHKQLRPSVSTHSLCEKNLNVSTFERLVRMKLPNSSLYVQNRMVDSALWPVQMFYDRLESNPVITGRIEPAAWFKTPICWWDHDKNESIPGMSKSIYNLYEADRVEALVGFLLCQDEYQPQDITVITPYSAQVAEIKNIFTRSSGYGINGISDVQVKTVDEFQGNESRIVILSLVRGFNNLDEDQVEATRSATRKTIGFLREENRLIVAVSRHKAALTIIGNSSVFRSDRHWGRLVDASSKRGILSNELVLRCPRHGTEVVLKDPDNLPVRGCYEPCGCVMECGHVCSGKCHDPKKVSHSRCNVRIKHTFPCGHTREVRCYEIHDPAVKIACTESITRTFERCKHRIVCTCTGVKDSFGLPVYENPQECTHTCTDRKFPCGHTCHKTCGHKAKTGEPCDSECLLCKDMIYHSFSSKKTSKSKVAANPSDLTDEKIGYMLQIMDNARYSYFSMLLEHVFPVLDGRYVRTDWDCNDGKVAKMQESVLEILLEQMNIKPPSHFKGITKVWPFLALKECAEQGIIGNFNKLCRMYLPETCNVTKDMSTAEANAAYKEVDVSLSTLTKEIGRVSRYVVCRIKEGRNAANYAKWQETPIEDAADVLNARLEVQDLDYIPNEAVKLKKCWGVLNDIDFEKNQEESISANDDPSYPTRAIPPKWEVPRSYLYKAENENGYFVSIDIKKANFTILRLYEPEFVDYKDTWEDYIQHVIDVGKFDVPGGFEYFKHMREAILGKLCHEKTAALEGHILRLIVRAIVRYYLENPLIGFSEIKGIFAFSCDELLIKSTDNNKIVSVYNHVVAAIRRFMPKAESFLRIEAIKLLTLNYTRDMVKKATDYEKSGVPKRTGIKYQQDTYAFNEEWKWREEKKPKQKEVFYARMTLRSMDSENKVVAYNDESTEGALNGLIGVNKRPPFVLKCIERELYVDGVYEYIKKFRDEWTPDIIDDDSDSDY